MTTTNTINIYFAKCNIRKATVYFVSLIKPFKMVSERIEKCIKFALKQENLNLTDVTIEVEGKSEDGEGFIGDIKFLVVRGFTENYREKVIHLAIKSLRNCDNVKNCAIPVEEAFVKEIFIYNKIKKTFQEFQKNYILDENLLNFMPHCYDIDYTKNTDLVLLENLKSEGYYNWDKTKPMTYDHVKTVLETYGKWHAFSFALKHHNKEIFNEITKNNVNLFGKLVIDGGFDRACLDTFKEIKSAVKIRELEKIDFELDDVKFIFSDLYFEDSSNQVILHGDCWNNNLMFKDDINGCPRRLKIIDWQLSGLGSPMIDLSHFLYCCCPENLLFDDFYGVLEIYYKSLAESLMKLRCDPKEIFPFDKVKEHWTKFSKYGLMISFVNLKLCLADPKDVPDFMHDAGPDLAENFKFPVKFYNEFVNRMKINLLHFAKHGDQ